MSAGKGHVLTSAECLKALQEKENEEKKKAEEKEQRNQVRLAKKQLKEEELKCKQQEKAQLKEAKCLEKQTKQPRQTKQRRNYIDNEVGNVTHSHSSTHTSVQVSNDTADDLSTHTSDDTTNSTLKQKPSSQWSQLQRGQKIMLMMRLILTGAASVLDALLMTQAQGGSG